jgi:putative transposase
LSVSIEYIHYNPIKHGLANAPANWAYSSFKRYVDKGIYNIKWDASVKVEFEDTVGYE